MNNQRGIKDQILNEMKVLRIIAFIVMAISLLSSLRKGINLDNLMEEHKLIYCCLGLISISFTPDFLLPDAIENLFFRENNRIERGSIIKKISHISFLFFTIVFIFSHFNNKFTTDKTINILWIGMAVCCIPYMVIDFIFQIKQFLRK